MEQILVIDDHADIRKNLAEFLKSEGYVVYTAANGEEGTAKVMINKPDLVLCDINMPLVDGFEVLQRLEKDSDTCGIPFIFLTGIDNLETRKKGCDMGADDFLLKPVCELELIASIRRRIKKSKLLQVAMDHDRQEYTHDIESLIYQVAHEARRPLCTLLGLVNLIDLNGKISRGDLKKILLNIKSCALTFDDRTSELTQQMLAVIVKNKLNVQKEENKNKMSSRIHPI